MREAKIFVSGILAGKLIEHNSTHYEFWYEKSYTGSPVSLTLPLREKPYEFNSFPAFFDGLLPEGMQLEALLRQKKINKNDYFSQLLAVGEDLVGNITARPA
jgi:serine/threonine-protein kinase HipA